MSFSIKFVDPTSYDIESGDGAGRITLGDFNEVFQVDLSFWSETDYQAHWSTSLERVLTGHTSCLITSLGDPASANLVWWWPLYPEGDKVTVQNHGLPLFEMSVTFDPEDPNGLIQAYRYVSDEGEQMSTWEVQYADIEAFLRESKRSG